MLKSDAPYTLLSAAQVMELEAAAIRQGTPIYKLMDRAGHAVAETVMKRFNRQPTLVLCGPGNNGRDAAIAARILKEERWPITVAKSGSTSSHDSLPINPSCLEGVTLIIDGLFGTGLTRSISTPYQELISAINNSNLPVVSVDIPSGIHTDSGAVLGTAIKSTVTITFGYQKLGHVLYPGSEYSAEVIIKDIGLGEFSSPLYFINHPKLWLDQFPIPTALDHKYTRGHAVLFGGEEFTGATQLASLAARRAGAGLVSIICSAKTHPIYAQASPGTITKIIHTLKDQQDYLQDARNNAFLIGPGLEPDQKTKELVMQALAYKRHYVIDAGALRCFNQAPRDLFQYCQGNVVLTPHEGEFTSLFKHQGSKLERALAAAQESQCVVVFKGTNTVIAHPGGKAYIQTNAPPWLATAGSGDILAGLVLGYLAQGVDPFQAAAMAVWVQVQCAQEIGFGLIAEDLIKQIPTVLKSLHCLSMC